MKMKIKNVSYLVRRLAIRSAKLTGISLVTAITCACVSQVFALPGDLYVSDLASNSVIAYSPDGTPTTFATGFNQPQGVAFDQNKNLYVADSTGTIFKIPLGGAPTPFVTGLSDPRGLTVTQNVLLVAENAGGRVTSIPLDDPTHVQEYQAVLNPIGVAAHASTSGDRFISNGSVVLQVDTAGASSTIYTAPGDGSANSINVQVGPLSQPDISADVFVSTTAGTILDIAPPDKITTFASGFTTPTGMDFRPKVFNQTNNVGDLYVADSSTGKISFFAKGQTPQVFVQNGQPNFIVFEVMSSTTTPTPTPTVSPTATPPPTATVSPTPTPTPSPTPTPNTGRLQNIATRGNVETGDNVLIGGFIIQGGTTAKTVLIRGIGPSLSTLDNPISNALADPVLELHKADGTVITNNNWKDSQAAAIMATGLAPTNDLESAILINLFPQNSGASIGDTVILRGNNGGTGVGVVEVYDLDDPTTATSQLANISTRGVVGTDDEVLIGGIIIGPAPLNEMVLLRAIGPSLQVPSPLPNPTLTVYNQDGSIIGTNDDWQNQTSGELAVQAIEATGMAPTNPKESALLINFLPGEYTAIVQGALGGSGVALVEAYHIQTSVSP